MAKAKAARNGSRFNTTDIIAVAVIGAIVAALGRKRTHAPEGVRDPGRDLAAGDIKAQQQRAEEPGRGRASTSPFAVPLAGWKDVFWRTYEQITRDRLLAVAAGVVFYGILAIFPAITAFVSVYGLFADATTVQGHMALIADVIPASAFGLIEEQVNRVATAANSELSFAFIFSLGLALWSANAGMKAVIDALNVAYNEEERRSFIRLTLISFAFTLGAIAAGLIGIGAIVVFPIILSYLGFATSTETLFSVLRWPVLFLALIIGLAVLYRFGPNRRKPRWEWLSVGSIFAALAWLAGSALLSFYFSNFANYNATYGSLAAGIGLMMWMWLSAIIVLLGAELNAELEHQTARDTTVGSEKPLGMRGAYVADTVGEAQD